MGTYENILIIISGVHILGENGDEDNAYATGRKHMGSVGVIDSSKE